jgi:hypothetical protein
MRIPLAEPAHRASSPSKNRPADADARHFEQFVQRNRCRAAGAHRAHKGRGAGLLALVLAPQIHFAEARPAKAGQLAEVVQLQHPTASKDLQPFFREALAAIGEVMHRADRAVCKRSAGSTCRRGGCHGHAPPLNNRRAGKKAQQIDKMASLAHQTPAADGSRSCVQCSAGIAPALTVMTKPWARRRRQAALHLTCAAQSGG